MENEIIIREMKKQDIPELLRLMEAIVLFEGDTDFSLSESDLLSRGFGKNPQFGAIVADAGNNKLVGIAVHYIIPFMHNLKPSLMLKWLYVDANQRGKNIGKRLLKGLAQYALNNGYKKFNWFVLGNNVDAQKFYSSIGAKPDDKWIRWTITPEKMAVLADQ
ncbi:GNAT family N-acetyltransferase [Sphingobacterium hotanense]|uniref:GNAT family N-acetyltransferase n=1 Tax=Sphingobacterium hotanense TaxID=649196 RepID=UPI0011F1E429|nr:GNAT family N-acetyltransferase [Sphingobacterium hotanense]